MFDRRIIATIIVVAAGAASAVAVVRGDRRDALPTPMVADAAPGPAISPLERAASPASDTSIDVVAESTATFVDATSTPDSGVSVRDVDELVAANRPPIETSGPDAAMVVDDGHDDPTARSTGPNDVGGVASDVVVTAWTWRFDDPPDRHRNALAPIASLDVVDLVAPTPDQQIAREMAGEVAWVIVRDVSVAGDVATVRFDHHVVSSTTAEQVTAQVVSVTINGGRAVSASV
jgi:hypothetical protein